MAYFGRAGAMLRQSLIRKLSQEWNGVMPPAPALYFVSRGMASSKLFVGGIAWGTDEESLREAFSSYGNLTEVKIIADRDTGRSRGFGFVSFTSDAEAESALQAMDGQSLAGRILRVNYAHSPGTGPRGGGMSRGFGLGAGRGGFGSGFGSDGGFGRSSMLPNDNDGVGRRSGDNANEGGGFNQSTGDFGSDRGGLFNSGGFHNEVGGKSELSNREQGSFGSESFGSKGGSFGFGASSFPRNTSGFGHKEGGLGQGPGGFGNEQGVFDRNSGGSGDFANSRGGFGGSPAADFGINYAPSYSAGGHERSQRFNLNNSNHFQTNEWRGLDRTGLNDEEGFVRSSGSLENGNPPVTDSWRPLGSDGSTSAGWRGSNSGDNDLASSSEWRGTNTQSFTPDSAKWTGLSNGSSKDWTGPSSYVSNDESKPLERENGSDSNDWRNVDNSKNSNSGWRGS